MEDAGSPARWLRDLSRKVFMKELFKILAYMVLVLAFAPLAGFWIVALVGAGLILLPLSAVVAKVFPAARRRIEAILAPQSSLRSAS